MAGNDKKEDGQKRRRFKGFAGIGKRGDKGPKLELPAGASQEELYQNFVDFVNLTEAEQNPSKKSKMTKQIQAISQEQATLIAQMMVTKLDGGEVGVDMKTPVFLAYCAIGALADDRKPDAALMEEIFGANRRNETRLQQAQAQGQAPAADAPPAAPFGEAADDAPAAAAAEAAAMPDRPEGDAPAAAPKLTKVQKIIEEIISTEESYIAGLREMVEATDFDAFPEHKAFRDAVANTIAKHEAFCQTLKDEMQGDSPDVGKSVNAMKEMQDDFLLALTYYMEGNIAVAPETKAYQAANNNFMANHAAKYGNTKTFEDYAITVAQRAPRYVLFAEDLIKRFDDSSPEYQGAQNFLDTAKALAFAANQKYFLEPITATKVSVDEVVTDLRLLNLELASKIELDEFDNDWQKKPELSPNITAYSKFTNQLGRHVAEEILKPNLSLQQRFDTYVFYLEVAHKCLKTGDFNSAIAIYGGLHGLNPTHRLGFHERLPSKLKEQFQELEQLNETRNNREALRAAQDEYDGPKIPEFSTIQGKVIRAAAAVKDKKELNMAEIERFDTYVFYLEMAHRCLKAGDFNSAIAIYGGLHGLNPTLRLGFHERLPSKLKEQFQELEQLNETRNNREALRAAQDEYDGSKIPEFSTIQGRVIQAAAAVTVKNKLNMAEIVGTSFTEAKATHEHLVEQDVQPTTSIKDRINSRIRDNKSLDQASDSVKPRGQELGKTRKRSHAFFRRKVREKFPRTRPRAHAIARGTPPVMQAAAKAEVAPAGAEPAPHAAAAQAQAPLPQVEPLPAAVDAKVQEIIAALRSNYELAYEAYYNPTDDSPDVDAYDVGVLRFALAELENIYQTNPQLFMQKLETIKIFDMSELEPNHIANVKEQLKRHREALQEVMHPPAPEAAAAAPDSPPRRPLPPLPEAAPAAAPEPPSRRPLPPLPEAIQATEQPKKEGPAISSHPTTRIDAEGGLTRATQVRGQSFIDAAKLIFQSVNPLETPDLESGIRLLAKVEADWQAKGTELDKEDILVLEEQIIQAVNAGLYQSAKSFKEVKTELENAENHLNWKSRETVHSGATHNGASISRDETPITKLNQAQTDEWLRILSETKPQWFKALPDWEQRYFTHKIEKWLSLEEPRPNLGEELGITPTTIRKYPGAPNAYQTHVEIQNLSTGASFELNQFRSGIVVPVAMDVLKDTEIDKLVKKVPKEQRPAKFAELKALQQSQQAQMVRVTLQNMEQMVAQALQHRVNNPGGASPLPIMIQTLFSPPFQPGGYGNKAMELAFTQLQEKLSTPEGIAAFMQASGIEQPETPITDVTMLYANRPVNAARAIATSLTKDEFIGEQREIASQSLKTMIDARDAQEPDNPNIVMASKALARYEQLKQEIDNVSKAGSAVDSALDYKFERQNLMAEMAGLEQLMMNAIGGSIAGSCISGKDRWEMITCITIAQAQFYQMHGDFPPNPGAKADAEQALRNEFYEMIAHQVLTGHGMKIAGENSIGCDGLKNVSDVFGRDICHVINRVAHEQYGIPSDYNVIKMTQKIAGLNKPGYGNLIKRFKRNMKGFKGTLGRLARRMGQAINPPSLEERIAGAKSFDDLFDILQQHSDEFTTESGFSLESQISHLQKITDDDDVTIAASQLQAILAPITRSYGLRDKVQALAAEQAQVIENARKLNDEVLAAQIEQASTLDEVIAALRTHPGPLYNAKGERISAQDHQKMCEDMAHLAKQDDWRFEIVQGSPLYNLFFNQFTRNYGLRDKFRELLTEQISDIKKINDGKDLEVAMNAAKDLTAMSQSLRGYQGELKTADGRVLSQAEIATLCDSIDKLATSNNPDDFMFNYKSDGNPAHDCGLNDLPVSHNIQSAFNAIARKKAIKIRKIEDQSDLDIIKSLLTTDAGRDLEALEPIGLALSQSISTEQMLNIMNQIADDASPDEKALMAQRIPIIMGGSLTVHAKDANLAAMMQATLSDGQSHGSDVLDSFHQLMSKFDNNAQRDMIGLVQKAKDTIAHVNTISADIEQKMAHNIASQPQEDFLTTLKAKMIEPGFNPETLAAQVASDMKQYNLQIIANLDASEFHDQAWEKNPAAAPHLYHLMRTFNGVTQGVATHILGGTDVAEQQALYQFYIELGSQALEQGDFLTASAVNSILNNSAIRRLSYLEDGLSEDTLAKRTHLEDTMSLLSNSKALREAMDKHQGPIVPEVTLALGSLVMADEQPTYIEFERNFIHDDLVGRNCAQVLDARARLNDYEPTPCQTSFINTMEGFACSPQQSSEYENRAYKQSCEQVMPRINLDNINSLDDLLEALPKDPTVSIQVESQASGRLGHDDSIRSIIALAKDYAQDATPEQKQKLYFAIGQLKPQDKKLFESQHRLLTNLANDLDLGQDAFHQQVPHHIIRKVNAAVSAVKSSFKKVHFPSFKGFGDRTPAPVAISAPAAPAFEGKAKPITPMLRASGDKPEAEQQPELSPAAAARADVDEPKKDEDKPKPVKSSGPR